MLRREEFPICAGVSFLSDTKLDFFHTKVWLKRNKIIGFFNKQRDLIIRYLFLSFATSKGNFSWTFSIILRCFFPSFSDVNPKFAFEHKHTMTAVGFLLFQFIPECKHNLPTLNSLLQFSFLSWESFGVTGPCEEAVQH